MRYFRSELLLAGYHADEPDPGVPELVHAGEQWAPAEFLIPDHAHGFWELYLQMDGETRWESWEDRCRPRRYRLTAGHFFAAPPNVRHGLNRPGATRHHFMFAGIDLRAVFARHPTLAGYWPAGRCVHLRDAASITGPFRQLARELATALPLRSEGLRAAVDYVVIEASRLLHAAADRANGAGRPLAVAHPAVQTVRDLLDRQPAHRWRLADLGRLTGLSPNHLASLFRAEVGCPPHRYLVRQRIERAKEMLAQTDAAVTDVALELGFASSQHFAKVFHQTQRCSARSFRRRHRGAG